MYIYVYISYILFFVYIVVLHEWRNKTAKRIKLKEVGKSVTHIEPRNQRRYEMSGSPSEKAMEISKPYTKAYGLLTSYKTKNYVQSEQNDIRLLNSDLLVECRDCEGLDDGPGWLRFALGLDAECHPDSSLGRWLETGLDPAKAGDGKDAILLDLCGGKGCQALKEPRADFGLPLMLLSGGLDERTLGHDFTGLHELHGLHWDHRCENEITISLFYNKP